MLRYIQRAATVGRAIGISGIVVREIHESRAKNAADRKLEESKSLRALVHGGMETICCDERGEMLTSLKFSELIGKKRDQAVNGIAFFIGGPDGLDQDLMAQTSLKISFGKMTWPHQLLRIMAAEQIYRAVTILNNHPYHRG